MKQNILNMHEANVTIPGPSGAIRAMRDVFSVIMAFGSLTMPSIVSANPATFVSSRPANSNGAAMIGTLPGDIPTGATVFKGSVSELGGETRTRSCAEIYGTPSVGVTYSGGPITEYRYTLSDGSPSPWSYQSGACQRRHEETRTAACPGTQQGDIVERRTYTVLDDDSVTDDSGWVELSRSCDYYKVSDGFEVQEGACPQSQTGSITMRRTFESWSDGSKRNYSAWVETSRSCSYFLVANKAETREVECPVNQRGAITQRRTYEQWSDGTNKNYSAWAEIGRTCAYYWVSNQVEARQVACPVNQSGAVYQQRTYEVWSDSTYRNYGAWVETGRTCAYYFVSTQYENSTQSCPAGQTGYVSIQRSYQLWSDGSARSHSAWYQTGSTCQAAVTCTYSYNNYVTILNGPGGNGYYNYFVNRRLVGSSRQTTMGSYSVGALDHTEWRGTGGDADTWIGDEYFYQICGPF